MRFPQPPLARTEEDSMTQIIKIAIAAFIFTGPLAFACDYPKRADIPNGTTATKDEMIDGQRAVKDYMATMETYLACIEKEENDTLASMPDISEEDRTSRRAALTKKYNAAVEEMELVAARFNEEVRAYKDKAE